MTATVIHAADRQVRSASGARMSFEEYQAKASELRKRAARAKDSTVRGELLKMADDWQQLAQRAAPIGAKTIAS
jgi:hypothetical protein